MSKELTWNSVKFWGEWEECWESSTHSRSGVRDVWPSPNSTHSFPSTLTFPFLETAIPYLFILLTPPRVPTHTLTFLADDLTSYFTANRCYHSILSHSNLSATTPLSTLCTCALCLSSCSHGCSVPTRTRARPHHPPLRPLPSPLPRTFVFYTYSLSFASLVIHQTCSPLSHLKAKTTKALKMQVKFPFPFIFLAHSKLASFTTPKASSTLHVAKSNGHLSILILPVGGIPDLTAASLNCSPLLAYRVLAPLVVSI